MEDITEETQHELDSTLGVLFVGFMLSTVLYGLTTFQMHVYYMRFPKDNRQMKFLVAFLWLIDTASSTMLSRMQYYYLVDRFEVAVKELEVTNVFLAETGLAGLAVLIVHLFYAFRVWTVSQKTFVLPGAIAVAAAASFSFNVAATNKLAGQHYMASIVTPEIELLLGLKEGLSIIGDVLIVASQAYYLRPSQKPHMKLPTGLLHRSILILASRGTVFMILHIALLVTLLTLPHSQVWIFLHFIISKVYINSLYAMLNTRKTSEGHGVYEEDNLRLLPNRKPFGTLVFGTLPRTSRAGQTISVASIASIRTRSNSAMTEPASEAPASTLDGHLDTRHIYAPRSP